MVHILDVQYARRTLRYIEDELTALEERCIPDVGHRMRTVRSLVFSVRQIVEQEIVQQTGNLPPFDNGAPPKDREDKH